MPVSNSLFDHARPAAGPLLLFLALGTINIFGVKPFRALDEPRHAAYAVVLATGRIPDIREPLPYEALHTGRIRGTNAMIAAVHPPLYYWIVGLPLKLGSSLDQMDWGVRVARFLTLLMGAVGLIYVFLLVRLLLPEDPAMATLATAFVAVCPAFVNVSALVHNDALAFLGVTGFCHAALSILVRGNTRARAVALCGWAAVAALTRFATLLIIMPALFATCVAIIFLSEGARSERVLRPAKLCGAVLATVLIGSGWFYWHNFELYGDITGGKTLLEFVRRKPRGPAVQHMLRSDLWLLLHDQLWVRLAGGVVLSNVFKQIARVFTVIAMSGLVLWAIDQGRRLPRLDWRRPLVAAWAITLLSFACAVLPIFEFYSRGGNVSARYYFSMIWVPALLIAIGVSRWRSRKLTGSFTVGAILLCLITFAAYMRVLWPGTADRGLPLAIALETAGMPWPWIWLTLLTLALGLGTWLTLREIEREPST